ncbi:vancomycin resistance protein YoaR [Brevibacterium sanguinis]|uniref:Vancomycin resistance protein YoaR n=2 Tax=Brevibacterium TaxID=1696 RepID=A0A366IKH2_9MICO|nr:MULTISPECIES: VanW family protein [Brevibacterium]RBP66282.1 vancomycin resistance protein YoaR [Brevibacterium sanguinis]RBP72933.1 vancomycin resistance protein YoaR [Brevibacterium celere]
MPKLDTSTPDDPTTRDPRRRQWTIALLVLVGLALAYIAIGFLSGRVVAPGTTVAGVDIGGKGADDAEAALSSELSERAAADIELSSADATATLSPEKAGLGLDVPATVGQVTGFTLDPTVIADRLFGDDEVAPVIDVDEEAFSAEAPKVTKALEVEPVNAEVTYDKTTPKLTEAVTGQTVDDEQLLRAIDHSWLRTDEPVEVEATAVDPDITTAEAQEVVDGFAADAVARPLTVRAEPGDDAGSEVKAGDLTVEPEVVAKTLGFEAKDSALVPVFDEKALRTEVLADNEEIGRPAEDATFRIVDGKPEVVEAKTGIGIKGEDLSQAVLDAIKGDEDKAQVSLETVEPEFTTEEARKADVSDVVSEFSTAYDSSPNRDNNLRVASRKVSGTVLQPGEQFSLNETLGQRTAANGYKPAGVISEGQMKEDFGGGVSQVSTTLFNAAFFAGFELDEHRAHSRYISRYPEGRETTLDWSSIDLKFTNTSKTPVVLDMHLSGGKVHAKVFGVKTLEVEADASERYNFTSPATITESGPDCTPQSPREGWSIKITRTMKEIGSGKETKDSFVTVYRPVNKVECK